MIQQCDIEDVVTEISKVMGVERYKITDVAVLKKGMTNRSIVFALQGKKYIMRIPGAGTEQLINRTQEAAVYRILRGKGISDEVVYLNSHNGYKVTEYLEGARVCDPFCMADVKRCMIKLREFHELKLKVEHEFDLFGQILFYESLWEDIPSVYENYKETRQRVFDLKPFIESCKREKVLSHMDAVPDNFLFVDDNVCLIDWEYAGMQDPHVDIAMFCIYSFYDRAQADTLIDLYFKEGCQRMTRIKIYCYIAVCGLLWSCWCEYKRHLGIEFGAYALRQYQYAVEYCNIVREEIRVGS